MLERLYRHAAAVEACCGLGLELQHERQSRSSRYRPIIVSRAAPGSLRIVDQRISNHLDRSASCCAHPAHNRAIKDTHCLNGLYYIRDRSARSLLERSCAALSRDSSSSCRLPPKSEHHSLSCNLDWECEITAKKLDAIRSGSPVDRKNVRQHLSFGFGIHRYVPRYRDGRHKSQGILVRARRDHCRRA